MLKIPWFPVDLKIDRSHLSDASPKTGGSNGTYPVIDLFAGPGGLGEGFASALDHKGRRRFSSAASIEHDRSSHQTLFLRHFVREIPEGRPRDDYYDFVSGKISAEELILKHPSEYLHTQETALCKTLGADHGDIRNTIRKRLNGAKLWALVGGPPCQAYSLMGRSRMTGVPEFAKDPRHKLYLEYLRIVADHRPPIFVMENVKGLLSAKIDGSRAITRIVSDLSHPATAVDGAPRGLHYKLYSPSRSELPKGEIDPRLFLVHADEYGVPQARQRMFIIGIRNDIDIKPGLLKKSKAPTLRQTIGQLPAIRSRLSTKDTTERWLKELRQLSSLKFVRAPEGSREFRDVCRALRMPALNALDTPEQSSSATYKFRNPPNDTLKTLYDNRLSCLTGHEARSHMASDLRRYLFASTFAEKTGRSPRLRDFPQVLLPDHSNVGEARAGTMFEDRFRVQLADNVSTTVTSHICKDGHYFIHYDRTQCRSLTVREAARLQTFPDSYVFLGPKTSQYHQVGNAVPVYLATQIADIVGDVLDQVRDD